MAISTNSSIEFYGTQDTVTAGGGTSAVSDATFSASGDVVSGGWANDDDALEAAFVLKFQYPSGTIDTGGIHLYARLMNIDGTGDAPQPSTTYKNIYLGYFPTDTALAATTDYYIPLAGGPAPLPNHQTSQAYEFYVYNDCGVTMTAGWTIKVTPITIGPHA